MSTDPRGPIRTLVEIDKSDFKRYRFKLSCGHYPDLNQHFSYVVGSEHRCFHCLTKPEGK